MMESVYLDHAATTPLDPRVRDADEIDYFLGAMERVVKQLGQWTTTTINMEDKQ